jgi:hypothetical protein
VSEALADLYSTNRLTVSISGLGITLSITKRLTVSISGLGMVLNHEECVLSALVYMNVSSPRLRRAPSFLVILTTFDKVTIQFNMRIAAVS